MRRLVPALAVFLASLAAGPAAHAATYVVDSQSDGSDADTAVAACATATAECTLRAAVEQANANPGLDAIRFQAGLGSIVVAGAPLSVTGAVELRDNEADAEVVWTGPGGDLLTIASTAAGSSLSGVTLRRQDPGAGSLLRVEAANVAVRTLVADGAAEDGIQLAGAAQAVTLEDVTASGSGDDGIGISDTVTGTALLRPIVTGNLGNGVEVDGTADGLTIADGQLVANALSGLSVMAGAQNVTLSSTVASMNGGVGVSVEGQNVVITRSPVFGNSLAPISLQPGANGGIAPPQGLRIGPRRADGSLPLTGTADGLVELFRGDPSGPGPLDFVTDFASGGGFEYVFSPEPAPGTVFAASVRGGAGTSAFATAGVPGDVASPDLVGALAISNSEVRVQASEPLDPAAVQPDDFVLDMAGQRRAVTSVSLSPSRTEVVLGSSGWTFGEAGFVQLAGPGALADAAGNLSLATTRFRVGAAPGDLLAPVGSSLSIRPRRMCFKRSRTCRRPGGRVSFTSNEAGRAQLVILRGNKRVGTDTGVVETGRNRIRFDGKIGSRRLRPGSYRMLLYIEDAVGNLTLEPPLQRFEVLSSRPPARTPPRRRR